MRLQDYQLVDDLALGGDGVRNDLWIGTRFESEPEPCVALPQARGVEALLGTPGLFLRVGSSDLPGEDLVGSLLEFGFDELIDDPFSATHEALVLVGHKGLAMGFDGVAHLPIKVHQRGAAVAIVRRVANLLTVDPHIGGERRGFLGQAGVAREPLEFDLHDLIPCVDRAGLCRV